MEGTDDTAVSRMTKSEQGTAFSDGFACGALTVCAAVWFVALIPHFLGWWA